MNGNLSVMSPDLQTLTSSASLHNMHSERTLEGSFENLQVQAETAPSSASKRKLQFFANSPYSTYSDEEYALIDVKLFEDMSRAVCPECHQSLKLDADLAKT
ncbi:hypothetical protein Btru_062332 [Bulinus truncatus]|nr:hypothetical protein Btru_062332 [Bulinus truncatus]